MAVVDIEFQDYNTNPNSAPHIGIKTKTSAGVMASMELTPLKLAKHAVFSGYLNLHDSLANSWKTHLGRFFTVWSCVDTDHVRNQLMATRDYLDSDPTPKGQRSEMLGMAMTRAVAADFFDVPWVCHTKMMNTRHGYQLIPAKAGGMKSGYTAGGPGIEADMIGFDYSGCPHFFEAKGTCSSKTEKVIRRKAINQASKSCGIKDANGNEMLFATRNACCFAFGDGFKGVVIDPPQEHTIGSGSYHLGLYGTLFDDYALLLKALQTHPTQRYSSDSIQFYGIAFDGKEGSRCILGLDVELFHALGELRFDDYRRILKLDSWEGSLAFRQMRRAERLAEWNEGMARQTGSVARFVGEQSSVYGSQDSANSITSLLKAKETVVGRDGIVLVEMA